MESDPNEKETLLSDAFNCVFLAQSVGSSAYLADVHAQLGLLCVRAGDLSDAVRHFESALAVDSRHITSLVGMAIMESGVGFNHNSASSYFTFAFRLLLNPHSTI